MAPSSLRDTNTALPSDPLLSPKLANPASTPDLPPSSALAIKALAVGRIALGVASLLAPRFTFALFQFPIAPNMTILPRIFGIRELFVGEFTLTAEDRAASDGGRREVKRMLWMNVGVDAVDIISVAYGVATGTMSRTAGGMFVGGAALCLGLAGIAMKGM